MARYEFADNAVLAFRNADKADANEIGQSLAEIAARHSGRMRAEHVVAAAVKRSHVLHQHFIWDDKKAAHLQRLDTARHLMRSVTIVEDDDGEEIEPPRRAWMSVTDADGAAYRDSETILKSQDLQHAVLRKALKDLLAWLERYNSLADVCDLVRVAELELRRKMARGAGAGTGAGTGATI